jgi:hypothetical protein
MGSGSLPGERRGGRTAGTPNRRTLEVAEKLEQLGCDPIEGMARLAMDVANSPELRGKMLAELAAYTTPRLKAVELTETLKEEGEKRELLVDRLIDLMTQIKLREQEAFRELEAREAVVNDRRGGTVRAIAGTVPAAPIFPG